LTGFAAPPRGSRDFVLTIGISFFSKTPSRHYGRADAAKAALAPGLRGPSAAAPTPRLLPLRTRPWFFLLFLFSPSLLANVLILYWSARKRPRYDGNETMDELAILLEARAPESNRMRFWRVRVGRDLFGSWNARVTFGRIGGTGRTMRYDFEDRDEAHAFVRKGLKRRKGAPRRCGATYQLVEASGEAGDLLSEEAGAPARPMPALPPTFWDWLEARRESSS